MTKSLELDEFFALVKTIDTVCTDRLDSSKHKSILSTCLFQLKSNKHEQVTAFAAIGKSIH